MRHTLRYLLYTIGMLGLCGALLAQQPPQLTPRFTTDLPDSVKAFTLADLYNLVLGSHPVVKQANLLDEQARQEIRLARGGFDPKIASDFNYKNLKGTEYFNIWNSSLKIPTWFPLDPKIAVDRHRGDFLNRERTIPESTDFWQVSAGFSLPVGKGLLIDERRATVRQAGQLSTMLQAEKVKAINKILLQATKDYWEWYYSYYQYRFIQNSLSIADTVFKRTRLNYAYGEAAVIDTVQAMITLQNRQIELQQAFLAFQNSSLILSNHLWGEGNIPLEITDLLAPPFEQTQLGVTNEALTQLKVEAMQMHPELIKLRAKRAQLGIEQRLNKEYLKPQLDLEYNFIDAPFNAQGESNPLQFGENYKFGLNFSFPIFLRKERAKLAKTNLKIQEVDFETGYQRSVITNEIEAWYNELSTTGNIVRQQQLMVSNYNRLVQAELLNLQNGESDLFKINQQQDKLIQSQVKLLKLIAGYQKAYTSLLWAAGVENLSLNP